jgi:hypothetical protein
MTVVKRVGVLSLGKVLGVLYALLGLIIGAFFSLFALVGAVAAGGEGGAATLLFGVGAIIMFPVLYGIGGFIGGIIVAALYNVVVSVAGGIELELEHAPRAAFPVAGV